MKKYGIVVGLAVGAVVLTGCGGKKNASSTPTPSQSAATDTGSPQPGDTGSPAPSAGTPTAAGASGAPTYTGPTVAAGAKCGTISVVAGKIQCTHAEYIYQLYAQKKTAAGTAVFSGWQCHKSTTVKGSVTCSRSGVTLTSPVA